MTRLLRPALSLFVLLSLITGLAYPVLVQGVAMILFPEQAGGSLIRRDGVVVGSRLIGQAFESPRYFWGRPSATAPQPYNGLASGGSNLGPTNPALLTQIKDRLAALRSDAGPPQGPVPAELVSASASGLDPELSPAAALFQVDRVAHARGLAPQALRELIARHVHGRTWGLLGAPRVNVLELNLALDGRG